MGAARTERERAYEASRREVADLDAQLQNARMSLNVDNPNAVAQFRQLLERRDAAYRQSSGALFTQYQNAVALYNERVEEYNARCADRPQEPGAAESSAGDAGLSGRSLIRARSRAG